MDSWIIFKVVKEEIRRGRDEMKSQMMKKEKVKFME